MIYILQLQKGKYYVGYTARKDGERFNEHRDGTGAKWTQKYPLVIVEEIREGTLQDEDEVTLQMMSKYGWTNVRGGKWCKVDMKKPPKRLLEMKRSEYCENSATVKKHPVRVCARCGHNNHSKEVCYATKHFNGHPLHPKALTPKKEACTAKRDADPDRKELDAIHQQMAELAILTESLLIKSVGGTMNVRLAASIAAQDLFSLHALMSTGDAAERVEVCYLKNPRNYDNVSERDTFLVVSNLRVFFFEARITQHVDLRDITSVHHESNWLATDIMHCTLRSGDVIPFLVQEGKSCAYLYRYVSGKISSKSALVHKSAASRVTITVPKWDYVRLPCNLPGEALASIGGLVRLSPQERLELIYLSEPSVPVQSLGKYALVCITSKRLVKEERGKLGEISLGDIVNVSHEHNLLQWDNIICTLKNGSEVRVGIYDSFSCQLFCLHLTMMLVKRSET